MTGFSADWLSLREPADHGSRAKNVIAAMTRAFAECPRMSVTDLACGIGSDLRCTYRFLSPLQEWTLVDHDKALLGAARDALVRWADDVVEEKGDRDLVIRKDTLQLDIRFSEGDLAAGIDQALPERIDLVTAAAFFDLVSDDYVERAADALAERKLPLYASLIYDGRVSFDPTDDLDAKMLAAFHEHMTQDKGFGTALGPKAAWKLETALKRRGFIVTTGESNWRLDASETLAIALSEGMVQAVGETGLVSTEEIDRWLDRHLAEGSWMIGHTDIFALPPD